MSRGKDVIFQLNSKLQLGDGILDIPSCPKCGRGGCLIVSREGLRKKIVQKVYHSLDAICEMEVWWDAGSEKWIGCGPAKYFGGCKCSKCISSDRRNPTYTREREDTQDISLPNC